MMSVELKLEPVGAHAAILQMLGDHRHNARIVELQRRQVNRDANVVGPLRCLCKRGGEHPFADLADQAGFFGKGHELRRRDRAACRMLPTLQRFEA